MTERTRLRRLAPLDPPMVPFAVAGTVVWLVLGLVFLAIRPILARGGNEDWPIICLTGAGVGLIGIVLMAIHDRGRARRPEPADGQADTDTVAR